MSELADIHAAQRVIAGRLVRTPVHRIAGADLGERLEGLNLVFKLEMLQRTGSFKIRGVLNKLRHLSREEKSRGVVGMSSGNHAQALAYGARLEDIPAVIVMPTYSVAYKVEATKALGAEVIHCEAADLLATYEKTASERGLTPVHPFDDPMIIAGAGTAGLELLEDAPELDAVVVPAGGGGLLSGVATAVKGSNSAVRVVGVEPQGACAIRKSLDAGGMVTLDSVKTVADGLAPPFTGANCLDRVQRFVSDVAVVNDEEIVEALRLAVVKLRVVAEPSAAAGLAALLQGRAGVSPGDTVGVVLSGGNINGERLKELL